MRNNNYLKDKYEFQLNRMAAFSDGVFAIAITLLVLEIHIPEFSQTTVTDQELLKGLREQLPTLISFVVSFFVIGLYWMAHHRMLKYVSAVNHKLIWNNLLFLFPIVIMPFSTALFSRFYYSGTLKTPFAVYSFTICLCGLQLYRLWKIITNSENKLTHLTDKRIIIYNSIRTLLIPICFAITFLLALITPWAYVIPPFIPLTTRVVSRYYLKKYPHLMEMHDR